MKIELIEGSDVFTRWSISFEKDGYTHVYFIVRKHHHIISCNHKISDGDNVTVSLNLQAHLPEEVQRALSKFIRDNKPKN